MSLSDGLDLIGSVMGRIVSLLMTISLFGIPIGVFFISAFIVRMIMMYVFSVESQYTSESISRGKSNKKGGGE